MSNVPAPVEFVTTQVDDHVKIELTSQLIKGISRVFQKCLNTLMEPLFQYHFITSSRSFPVIFILDLNESIKLLFGSSL